MNRQTTERLDKRLTSLERAKPETLPTVEWHLILPSPDGPRWTGEVIRWEPAASAAHEHGDTNCLG